jgi:hypothetical protein
MAKSLADFSVPVALPLRAHWRDQDPNQDVVVGDFRIGAFNELSLPGAGDGNDSHGLQLDLFCSKPLHRWDRCNAIAPGRRSDICAYVLCSGNRPRVAHGGMRRKQRPERRSDD